MRKIFSSSIAIHLFLESSMQTKNNADQSLLTVAQSPIRDLSHYEIESVAGGDSSASRAGGLLGAKKWFVDDYGQEGKGGRTV